MFDLSFSCRESGRLGRSPPEVRKNPLSDRFLGRGEARDGVSIGRHAHQHTPTYIDTYIHIYTYTYVCPVDNSFSRGKLRVFFSIVVASKKKRSNAFPRFSSTPFFFFFFFFPPYHGSHHVQLALKRKCFYTSRSIDPSHLPLQTLSTIPKNMFEETEHYNFSRSSSKERNLNLEISSSRYIFRIIFFFLQGEKSDRA